MAHISPVFPSVRDRLLKEMNDSGTHADGVERILELASGVSPRERAHMERTIGVIIHAREAIFQAKPNDPGAKARLEMARAAAQRLRSARDPERE
jgi:hypothetical protein